MHDVTDAEIRQCNVMKIPEKDINVLFRVHDGSANQPMKLINE